MESFMGKGHGWQQRVRVLAITVGFCAAARAAGFAGGTGDRTDPYQIATAEQLISIGADPNLLDKHYILVVDIDLGRSRVFEKGLIGEGWPHYGFFNGTFDGQGHVIRNLVIHASAYEDDRIGLFCGIGAAATVTNLGLVDVEILAGTCDDVGALAGANFGTVTRCYSTGRVVGDASTGGLIGYCGNYGSPIKLQQCWSSATVKGSQHTGGLVGDANIEIFSCFATGSVEGGQAGGLAGFSRRVTCCYATGKVSGPGLVGYTDNCIVLSYSTGGSSLTGWTNGVLLSYHLAQSHDQGTARTEQEMKDPATFRGWAYAGQWVLNAGQDYPRLVWEGKPGVPITDDPKRYGGGTGTESDPYQIQTAAQMAAIGWHPADYDKRFILMADLDMAAVPPEEIVPIGTYPFGFTGILDGQDHTVANFHCHAAGQVGSGGFFGRLGGSDGRGTVRKLHLVDVDVTGTKGAGGLVAYSTGTMESCTVTGTVKAGGAWYDSTGGLAGYSSGRIVRCSAVTQVEGASHIGGLVGNCGGGQIIQCFSAGTVKGSGVTGGLIGWLQSTYPCTIESCYSISEVQGVGVLGGLIGWSRAGLVSTSYFAGRVAQTQPARQGVETGLGGLIGKNESASVFSCYWDVGSCESPTCTAGSAKTESELAVASTFTGWGWDDAWTIDEGKGYPHLAWEGADGVPVVDDPLRYAGGTGEPNDPYQIATAQQLADISHYRADWDKHFMLMNDLDLDGSAQEAILPIGRDHLPFTGSFNGAGRALHHLTVRSEDGTYVGLFGCIGTSTTDACVVKGRVEYLRIEDANAVGRTNVGILAGLSAGTITSCDVTGTVTAEANAGALVGYNQGLVHQCYASVDVNAMKYGGGVVGYNEGSINQCGCQANVRIQNYYGGGLAGAHVGPGVIVNCLATGTVSGAAKSYGLGGLIGHGSGTGVANCYAVVRVTAGEGASYLGGLVGGSGAAVNSFFLLPTDGGGPDNGVGLAVSNAQLRDRATFSGWDFAGVRDDGTSEVWMMPPSGGPPVLTALQGLSSVDLPGSGTADDPYLVASAEQLGEIARAPDASYRLLRDIDLSGILWTTAIVPVLGGSLDGDGHKITHMSMTPGSSGGLIGLVLKGASVQNLAVTDASVIGVRNASYLGILAGINQGSLVNCRVEGAVTGSSTLGGLAGKNDQGATISRCRAAATVVGTYSLGGLVGHNEGDAITDCYASGIVCGTGNIGGLIGANYRGAVERCYATAWVSGRGTGAAGGLVGSNNTTFGPTITDCYFLHADDGGGPDNDLGEALTADEMRQPSSFVGWRFRSSDAEPNDVAWIFSPDGTRPVLSTSDVPAPIVLAGGGTVSDPYLITSPEDLKAIASNPRAYYRLAHDLDLAGIQWRVAPVPVFDGSFDGAGHTVRNLQVTTGMQGGLFGLLTERAVITDLRLENASVTGLADAENMGLLAGVSSGTVRNCSTAGSVTTGKSLGGLVGLNSSGAIIQCASDASVNGKSSVGGLVGLNQGVIADSYCTGAIRGHEKSGGVVGYNQGILAYAYSAGLVTGDAETGGCIGNNAGTVAACYFLSREDGGGSDNGYGTALSRDELLSRQNFVEWDFASDDADGMRDVWSMPPGEFPCLAWQTAKSGLVWLCGLRGLSQAEVQTQIQAAGLVFGGFIYDYDAMVPANRVMGLSPGRAIDDGTQVGVIVSLGDYDWQTNPGDGTADRPFVLERAGHLTAVSQDVMLSDKHFVLSRDIDLTDHLFVHPLISPDTGKTQSEFQGTAFIGVFDGRGHTISGLDIVSADDYVGLFGMVGNQGRVQDLSLENARVIGRVITQSNVKRRCGTGTLVGEVWGTVTRCRARGVVIGSDEAGGLIGKSKGTVADCTYTGMVKGVKTVGGLVGTNCGLIRDSYATALVEGIDIVGGLAGTSGQSDSGVYGQSLGIVNCYASGVAVPAVTTENAGGLVGSGPKEKVISSYFLRPADGGGPDNLKGVALSSEQMKLRESFSRWDFYGTASDGWEDHWFLPAGGPPVLSYERDLTGLVRVPDVSGRSPEEASFALEQAGFSRGPTRQDFHRTIAEGAAVWTQASPYAPEGAALPVTVSLGPYDWKTNPGKGTTEKPYQIATASQLDCLADRKDLWSSCFVLTSDLDMAGRYYTDALLGPYSHSYKGTMGTPFNGSFDGNGHRIMNLRIEVPSVYTSDYRHFGVFAWIGTRGRVMNLGLENVSVAMTPRGDSSYEVCGSLTGCNDGQITACYAQVAATGCGSMGGLVGENTGTISECYVSGYMEPVLYTDCYGNRAGLVWSNTGTITCSYAACRVVPVNHAAGLVGSNSGKGKVVNCLWDLEVSGCETSQGGLGVSTRSLMSASILALNGWADSINWVIEDGKDYPRLRWQQTGAGPIGGLGLTWLDGWGTPENPYRINDADQLVRISESSTLWDKHFLLVKDLDMSGTSFRPVGVDATQPFSGTLDGAGHVIANLTLSRGNVSSQYLGLVGCVGATGRIVNVRLQNATMSTLGGVEHAGLLVGLNAGRVDTCSASGSVNATWWGTLLGGLIGENTGQVTRCRADGVVASGSYSDSVGGLVGKNSGTIRACYAMVSTMAGDYVGGLVGTNSGTIRRSYASGTVTAIDEEASCFGAIVGENKGTVDRCLWDTSSSGCLVSDGGLGLTTAQIMDRDMLGLNGWVGDPNWVLDDGKDYPRLAWEGSPGTPITTVPSIDWLEGDGTSSNPYQIARAEQLVRLGRASVLWNRSFELVADLDLNGYSYAPIGAGPGLSFTGIFDGGEHVIHHLTIDVNDKALRYSGLFGAVGKSGQIYRLGLRDVRLRAGVHSSHLGCLAGWSEGTVSRCYVTGAVTGGFDAYRLGGLCGMNSKGVIRSCYAQTAVNAGMSSFSIGGLVGTNAGRMSGVYSTGVVTADMNTGRFPWGLNYRYLPPTIDNPTYDVGGLVGCNYGPIAGALWDKQTSRTAASDGGLGLTSGEMKDPGVYALNGWSFDPNWTVGDGNDYPRLAWEGTSGQRVPAPNVDWLEGNGTKEDPYRISSAAQMVRLGISTGLWDKCFILTSDLDFSGLTPPSLGINDYMAFNGVFDGQGHVIRNLRIERYGSRTVALFGYVGSTGQVRNLGIPGARVDGCDYVAPLAGCNDGNISQCYATGTVTGHSYPNFTGGLVGCNRKGTVSNCYSQAQVTGDWASGGLVGGDENSLIVNCYTVSTVAADYGGALLGLRYQGNVRSCYHLCTLLGDDTWSDWNAIGTALTEAQAKQRVSFAGWDFDQIWTICDGQDYPRLRWENIACPPGP